MMDAFCEISGDFVKKVDDVPWLWTSWGHLWVLNNSPNVPLHTPAEKKTGVVVVTLMKAGQQFEFTLWHLHSMDEIKFVDGIFWMNFYFILKCHEFSWMD